MKDATRETHKEDKKIDKKLIIKEKKKKKKIDITKKTN